MRFDLPETPLKCSTEDLEHCPAVSDRDYSRLQQGIPNGRVGVALFGARSSRSFGTMAA